MRPWRRQPLEDRQDLLRGGGVQVAGRLVGEDQRRVGDQRAGDRDALLLAAGQLGGQVVDAVAQPDLAQRAPAPGAGARRAAEPGVGERQLDVGQRRACAGSG